MHIGVQSCGCIAENLVFKAVPQVEGYVVSINLNGKREELHVEFQIGFGQILDCEAELAIQDENFDCRFSVQLVRVFSEELNHITVSEHPLASI